MTVSSGTFLVLGAVLGIVVAYVTPTVRLRVLKDDQVNGNSSKSKTTKTSRNSTKDDNNVSKHYGDVTMYSILEMVASEISKLWNDNPWKIVIPTDDNMSDHGSSYEDARSQISSGHHNEDVRNNFIPRNNDIPAPFNINFDDDDDLSTQYRSFCKDMMLPVDKKENFKEKLQTFLKGIKRTRDSRQMNNTKSHRTSTFKETERRRISFGKDTYEQLQKLASDTEIKSDTEQNHVVINLKKSKGPIQKIIQYFRNKKNRLLSRNRQNERCQSCDTNTVYDENSNNNKIRINFGKPQRFEIPTSNN